MRFKTWKLLAAGVALAGLVLGAGLAEAASWTAKYKGKIVVLRYAAAADMDLESHVKDNKVTGRAQDTPGFWDLHLFTVFKGTPGTKKIYLLLYDKADPESIKKKEPVTFMELPVKPTATVFMTSVNLEEDAGVKPGKYLIKFVATVGKSEKVLSTGEVGLVREAP